MNPNETPIDEAVLEEAEAAVQEAPEAAPGVHDPTGITRNDELGRYELSEDGIVAAVLDFRDEAGVRIFTHVEVEPRLRGAGVAGRLVEAALEETRDQGLSIRPLCPYVRSYVEEHPEWASLLAAGSSGGAWS